MRLHAREDEKERHHRESAADTKDARCKTDERARADCKRDRTSKRGLVFGSPRACAAATKCQHTQTHEHGAVGNIETGRREEARCEYSDDTRRNCADRDRPAEPVIDQALPRITDRRAGHVGEDVDERRAGSNGRSDGKCDPHGRHDDEPAPKTDDRTEDTRHDAGDEQHDVRSGERWSI